MRFINSATNYTNNDNNEDTVPDLPILSEIDIKEQLYILYLEIKGEINRKCIEIEKSKFDEDVSNFKTNTLINYFKELIYILLNTKFPDKSQTKIYYNNSNNELNTNEKLQLENQIKKLEADVRLFLKKEFQNNISKDALEMKINAYMEMEKEYESLKEKVRYDNGKFLTNDRKDNEILILRNENGILKKEIIKKEEIIEKYIIEIHNLKTELNNLNQKLLLKENHCTINVNNNNYNNSSTINNNSNNKSSLRWAKKMKKEVKTLHNINNNINNNNANILSMGKSKKIISSKLSKLETKNKELEKKNYRGVSGGHKNITKKKSEINGSTTTIDTNNYFTSAYNKILKSLMGNNNKGNKTPAKKNIKVHCHKKNSVSMCVEDYEKPTEININKFSSNKTMKLRNGSKENDRIISNVIPNSKFPLSNKNNLTKKMTTSTLHRKYLKNKNSFNCNENHSFVNIRKSSKE